MRTLGIDPGAAHNGWALLSDGALLETGQVNADGKVEWKRRRQSLLPHLQRIVKELQPDLVCIEATKTGGGRERNAAAINSQATYTRQTEELARDIMDFCKGLGIPAMRCTEGEGKKRLGFRGNESVTDRQLSERHTLLTGRPLLVKDHHEARAYGVALHGQSAWRIEQAKGRVA